MTNNNPNCNCGSCGVCLAKQTHSNTPAMLENLKILNHQWELKFAALESRLAEQASEVANLRTTIQCLTRIPNATTIQAIEDIRDGKVTAFSNVEDLMKDLNSSDEPAACISSEMLSAPEQKPTWSVMTKEEWAKTPVNLLPIDEAPPEPAVDSNSTNCREKTKLASLVSEIQEQLSLTANQTIELIDILRKYNGAK